MFLHGSRSGFQISLDLDPESGSGFKFLWIRIRIRFSNFLDPDLDSVSAKILEKCRKVSKSDLSEENLKFITKDRQKMKKAAIFFLLKSS